MRSAIASQSDADRLAVLLARSSPSPDGCWLWQGYIDRDGYGHARVRDGETTAHRAVYLLSVGTADGMEVDHLCRNRACVNPDHLEAVTRKENILRSGAPTAQNARKTQCVNGHGFTPENTYVTSAGWRNCRVCNKEARRRYRLRKVGDAP